MKNKQRGFAMIIELMIASIVIGILFAMAVPGFLALQHAADVQNAKRQINTVAQAQSAIAICAISINCNSSAVTPLVPASGSTLRMEGYVFAFTQTGGAWTYVATPQITGKNYNAYFVDSSLVLRCAPDTATVTSPVCP